MILLFRTGDYLLEYATRGGKSMVRVKTRDWGAQFNDVSDLIQRKSQGLAQHEINALAEVTAHDGTHAYGRHGFQTGWEAQFVRAATRISPDQAFDPRGLNPTIRRWSSSGPTPDVRMLQLFDPGGAPPGPVDYKTVAGATSGGFITPEAQEHARSQGSIIAQRIAGPNHYAAQWRFKTGPHHILTPLNSILVAVPPYRPGAPYGLGFSPGKHGSAVLHDRRFVVKCIDAFFRRLAWRDFIGPVTSDTHKASFIRPREGKIAFPEMSDLASYFDLDIRWQKSATLIFRRNHNAATHSHDGWRLITMYPDDREAGWAPSLWFSDENKRLLRRDSRFNADTRQYFWTGGVCNFEKTNKQDYPVPAWAAAG